MATFNSIFVPTDFSSYAGRALEVAVQLAKDFGAALTLVHAWELPLYSYSELTIVPAQLLSSVEEAAQSALNQALAELRKQVPGANAILSRGYPADEILRVAEDTKVDLIVMGTHGRRGLSHVLLGSVAERVVRRSPVPVLTVRSSHAEHGRSGS
jgi:nucleotide-binding universal stress UspA family protein